MLFFSLHSNQLNLASITLFFILSLLTFSTGGNHNHQALCPLLIDRIHISYIESLVPTYLVTVASSLHCLKQKAI